MSRSASRLTRASLAALCLLGSAPFTSSGSAIAATPALTSPYAYLAALIPAGSGGTLGSSIAVAGNTVLAAAPDANDYAGAVLVFVHSGKGWHQRGKISKPSDSGGPSFGASVAVTRVGGRLLAVIGDTGGASGQGDAYIYGESGRTWHQIAKLTDPDKGPAGGANFGTSVAISGTTAIVGADKFWANKPAVGAAYIYRRTASGWQLTTTLTAPGGHRNGLFGNSVGIQGATAIIGAPNIGQGIAYIFTRTHGNWRRQATLLSLAHTRGGAWFGSATALSGNTVVVGASSAAEVDGAAFVYTRSGATWRLRASLADPVRGNTAGFGSSVAVENRFLLVGAPDAGGCGIAYLYLGSGSAWKEHTVVVERHCVANDEFGSSVAISGRIGVVGARLKNDNDGAIYSITLP